MDAFTQHFKGFVTGEYTVGTRPESFNDHRPLRKVKQYDDTRMGVRSPYFSHHLQARGGPVSQIGAYDGHVGGIRILGKLLEDLCGLSSTAHYPNRLVALLQSPYHQLALQAVRVQNKDSDWVPRFWVFPHWLRLSTKDK